MRSDNPECYISKHERGDYICEKAVEDLRNMILNGLMELLNQNFHL
jgi:hypothetical protein